MRSAAVFVAVLAAVLAVVALGGAAIVYGGVDDSPGLQLIGVVIVVAAIVVALRWRGGATRDTSSDPD